jgi:hypothetical protein
MQSSQAELTTYDYLQNFFAQIKFLVHFELIRILYINVNVFKKREFEAMIFHVKRDSRQETIFKRINIESILFLSKCLIKAKIRY